MLIIIGFNEIAHGVLVVLASSGETIEVIVKAFPLGGGLTDILEVSIMQLSSLVKHRLHLNEIIANNASEFPSIEQNQELGFHSGVKVHLDHGGLVTVYSDVLELLVLGSKSFIVLFEFWDHWVPLGCEVE